MVFDFLRRRKDDKTDVKIALAHGILAGESQRQQLEQELMRDLQINIHIIEDENVVETINAFINYCAQQGELDFDLFALRNLVSKLIRASRLDRIDAYILTLEAQEILQRIEMNMSEDLVKAGVLNYIESINILLQTAFCDAIGGWKAKLLKVTPRYFEVTMPEAKKQKSWMGE